jgi:hypothetical protein
MPRIVFLTLCLFAFTAVAQPGPILVIEHDWRFFGGNNSYGVLQTSLRGASNHWTGIYCGRHLITVKMRIGELFTLVLVPFAVLAAVLLTSRTPKAR